MQYGFVKADEQINVIFAVMLYIMEQSLKEENCTMDDIGAYIDDVNVQHFKKNLTYEDCRKSQKWNAVSQGKPCKGK